MHGGRISGVQFAYPVVWPKQYPDHGIDPMHFNGTSLSVAGCGAKTALNPVWIKSAAENLRFA